MFAMVSLALSTALLAATSPHARAVDYTFSAPAELGTVHPGLFDSVYHLGEEQAFAFAADEQTIDRAAAYAANHHAGLFLRQHRGYLQLRPVLRHRSWTLYADQTPTNTLLGADASGAAASDTALFDTTVLDARGYIYIAQAGTYTIDSAQADDAVRVYLGGTGTPGSGTDVFEMNFSLDNEYPPTLASGPAVVNFTQPGYYPVEVFFYNQYSTGEGMTGLQLSFTPAAGLPAATFVYTDGLGSFPITGNLLVNGDFSQGNRGFATNYTLQTTDQGTTSPLDYGVVHSPAELGSANLASFGDHTNGHGLMMVCDGSTDPTQYVWQESVVGLAVGRLTRSRVGSPARTSTNKTRLASSSWPTGNSSAI